MEGYSEAYVPPLLCFHDSMCPAAAAADADAAAVAAAAAGTSGPSAEGLSDAERSAAAQELLMVNLVLPDKLQEDDM